jgi:hypothetical protein
LADCQKLFVPFCKRVRFDNILFTTTPVRFE